MARQGGDAQRDQGGTRRSSGRRFSGSVGAHDVATWEVDGEALWTAIRQALATEGAVYFGRTQDGGAICVKLWTGDGAPWTDYASSVGALTEFIGDITDITKA